MEEELEQVQLIVEMYDELGNFEGEWDYEVSRDSIENWEKVDWANIEDGMSLVRFLLLSRLKEHSPLTWKLLSNNTSMGEFLTEGVPKYLVEEIPRLSIVNIAVERMYACLSKLVIEEQIRIEH